MIVEYNSLYSTINPCHFVETPAAPVGILIWDYKYISLYIWNSERSCTTRAWATYSHSKTWAIADQCFLGRRYACLTNFPTLPLDMEQWELLQHNTCMHCAAQLTVTNSKTWAVADQCFLGRRCACLTNFPTLPLDMEQWELLQYNTCMHCAAQVTVTSSKTWALADHHTGAEATRDIITLSEHIQLHKGQH